MVEGRADWRRLLAEWSAGDVAMRPTPDERSDQWFREAQAAYLAGDWVSAEQTLLKLLRHDARDAEARLMLATLWRHEGRLDAASRAARPAGTPGNGGALARSRSRESANEFAQLA